MKNPNIPSLAGLVFISMLNREKYCLSEITVIEDPENVSVIYDGVSYKNRKDLEKIKCPKFFDTLEEKTRTCKIVMIPLVVAVKAGPSHQTLIFMYRGGDKKIIMGGYDPQGFKADHAMSNLFARFLDGVESTFNDMEIGAHIYNLHLGPACPIGLQTVSGDRIGFCIMWSYLWLYLVGKAVSDIPKLKPKDFMEIITNIEKYTVDYTYRVPGLTLQMLIYNFSVQVYNNYMHLHHGKIVKDFESEFFQHVTEKRKGQVRTVEKSLDTSETGKRTEKRYESIDRSVKKSKSE
jgi:hypothetical protein